MDPYPRVEKPSPPMELQYGAFNGGPAGPAGPAGSYYQAPPYTTTERTPIMSVQQDTAAPATVTCRKPPEMMTIIDVPDENIYLMTPHVQVGSDSVFLEPESVNSFDVVHKLNGAVFKYTQLGVYRFLTLLLGIPMMIVTGILFAIMNFMVVFMMQPMVKILFIFMRPIGMMCKAILRSVSDPMWQSMGLIYSRISGKCAFNIKGLQQTAPRAPGGQAAIEEVN